MTCSAMDEPKLVLHAGTKGRSRPIDKKFQGTSSLLLCSGTMNRDDADKTRRGLTMNTKNAPIARNVGHLSGAFKLIRSLADIHVADVGPRLGGQSGPGFG